MASKPTANAKRSDLFQIPIDEIVIDEKQNGRWENHDGEAILELAKSIVENGQLQPCVGRRVGNEVHLSAGYRRALAVKHILQDPDLRAKVPGDLFLKVTLVNQNAEDAFVTNVIENKNRRDTSSIDDAHNHERLKRFGWTDQKIADLYGIAVSYVGQLRKLLQLPADVQRLVHRSKIAVGLAINMVDLPAEQLQKIVTDANGENGVDRDAVNEQIRQRRQAQGRKHGRSIREVRQYFEAVKSDEDQSLSRFASDLLRWLGGQVGDAGMDNAFKRFRESV